MDEPSAQGARSLASTRLRSGAIRSVDGFALLDVLLAISLLGIGISAALLLHLRASQAVFQAAQSERATTLIQSLHEQLQHDPGLVAALRAGGGGGFEADGVGCEQHGETDALRRWQAKVVCELPTATVTWAADTTLLQIALSWGDTGLADQHATAPTPVRQHLAASLPWPP